MYEYIRHLLAEEASYEAICLCYFTNLTQQTIHHTFCLSIHLKVLSSEMDQEKVVPFKALYEWEKRGDFQLIPCSSTPIGNEDPIIANSAHSSVCGLFIYYLQLLAIAL
jgi:hypothetical protein